MGFYQQPEPQYFYSDIVTHTDVTDRIYLFGIIQQNTPYFLRYF